MARYEILGDDQETPGRYEILDTPRPKKKKGEGALMSGIRGFNQALAETVTLPYRGLDWLMEKGSGGRFGLPDIDKGPGWGTYLNQPEPQTMDDRIGRSVGRGIGYSALPTAGVVAAAPGIAAGARTAQQTSQFLPNLVRNTAEAVAARPGAAIATDAIAAGGAGFGEQMSDEAGFGPVGRIAGATIGSMAPFGAYAAAQKVWKPIRRGLENLRFPERSAYDSFLGKIDNDVDGFARQVAVGPTRQDADINATTMGIYGRHMERTGNPRAARSAALDEMVQQGVPRATAEDRIRRMLSAHKGSDLMMGEYQAVSGTDAATRLAKNPDLNAIRKIEDSQTQGLYDYVAQSGNTKSASIVANAIGKRQDEVANGMRSFVEKMAPGGKGIDDVEPLINGMKRQSSADYKRAIANAQPFDLKPLFDRYAKYYAVQGPDSPVAKAVMKTISVFENRRMVPGKEYAVPVTSARRIPVKDSTGAVIAKREEQLPVLTADGSRQKMRYVGRKPLERIDPVNNLADFISRRQAAWAIRQESLDQFGRPTAVTRELDKLRRVMDKRVGTPNPQWKAANDRWRDMELHAYADRLGEAFSERAGPEFRRSLREFNRLAPTAQDIIRIHMLQRIDDKLTNLPDTHSVSKLFTNPQVRRLIQSMFGDDAAAALTRRVRDMAVADVTRGSIRGSQTHKRGQVQKAEDAEVGIVDAVNNASFSSLKQWVSELGTSILRERKNRPLARIITTKMSDMPEVARHINNLKDQRNRMLKLENAPPPLRPYVGAPAGAFSMRDPTPINTGASEGDMDERERMQLKKWNER